MGTTTECPLCDTELDARGLGSHKNSKPCRAAQGRKRLREGQIAKVSDRSDTRRKAYIEKTYGSDAIEEVPVSYEEGGFNSRATLKRAYCADEELVREAQRQALPTSRGSKHRIQADEARHLLIADDTENLILVEKDEKGASTSRKRKVRVATPSLCDTPICYTTGGEYIGDVVATDITPIELSDYAVDERVVDLLLEVWAE